jgi:hypothetical protein
LSNIVKVKAAQLNDVARLRGAVKQAELCRAAKMLTPFDVVNTMCDAYELLVVFVLNDSKLDMEFTVKHGK